MSASSSTASSFETIIGLEVHAQLKTGSKMFCGCRVEFGAPPNTLVCPVCLGLPGALPVTNSNAIALALRAALALGCAVHTRSVFARKNYFYHDLPKGFQITQYDQPLATDGSLALVSEVGGEAVSVRIRRLHLEEDAGKSLHDRFPGLTAVDLNRAGIPLIEIVSEPDLRSPALARAYVTRLKQTLEYLEVSDGNMEEGSLRVDANVSVRPRGSRDLGTKSEVKNMNSFSQLEKALTYVAAQHVKLTEAGSVVEHQTMLWDPARGEARPMREKEDIHDYRYFPEPDLPTLVVSEAEIERTRRGLPELPWQKEERFVHEYGLPGYDAEVLSATRPLADFFEAVAGAAADPKTVSNWVMGEVMAACNEGGVGIAELGLEPGALAELIGLVGSGTLSNNLGKQVLRKMIETGKAPEQIIDEDDLSKVSDVGQIEAWVAAVIEDNPKEVERYRRGEEKLLSFFIGQVMQKSKGRADPARLREVLLGAINRDSGG
ncbi:MAG: Asp-tRNA(Asn)/Glu-tRNA(Gln) amidotransferase subunit GatB [Gemmatimonadota bacterium]